MDLATASAMVGGRRIGANPTFLRVTTDSRALERGDLFVALRGERFDGHAFVPQALRDGAVAAMVAEPAAASLAGDLVVVPDTQQALGRLAGAWRARFDLPLAIVVGSNGKTTVKEMTAAALAGRHGVGAVLATQGNLNNAIGLPLTLLRLREAHRSAVVELGMNHRGETAELAAIAKPTIAVVNNAQREHQEFMQNVAEVAAEHADAILALPAGGVAVINADDPHAGVWREAAARAGARVVGFGTGAGADVRGEVALAATGSTLEVATAAGRTTIALAVPGLPMAQNALAAVAAALAAGADLASIRRGLEAFRAVPGRLATSVVPAGAVVIDDTYNANPDSVRAAIDVLARAARPRILVLGDMGEVGTEGPAFHREVGAYARAAGIDRLYAVGAQAALAAAAFGAGARHFDDVGALAAALAADAVHGATVLVKGSRFMRMERVVAALAGTAPRGGH
jgi:UDP-N-acetylmuramoyl-tripeptide--D-alanyl-D-alanine ligase